LPDPASRYPPAPAEADTSTASSLRPEPSHARRQEPTSQNHSLPAGQRHSARQPVFAVLGSITGTHPGGRVTLPIGEGGSSPPWQYDTVQRSFECAGGFAEAEGKRRNFEVTRASVYMLNIRRLGKRRQWSR
jgi:hypothetical protein